MRRTALVLLLAGLVSAGCGGAGSDGSVAPLEALAPAAEPAPTTTTLAPLAPVAAPKPAAVTVTTKRAVTLAVAPQPVVTTMTTAALVAPVTPTTMAVVSDPTTTTTAVPAQAAPSCSLVIGDPAPVDENTSTVTVAMTSNMPNQPYSMTVKAANTGAYAVGSGKQTTGPDGTGSFTFTIMGTNGKASVEAFFYKPDGYRMTEQTCRAFKS